MHTTCCSLARPTLFWREERQRKSDGGRYGKRHLKEILRKWRGKHGLVTAAYPVLSLQTPPWSQGGSWGRSGASFYLQWQGNYPYSAFPPREAPELNAGLLKGSTRIFQYGLISLHSQKRKPSTQPVKQPFLVRDTGLSTLLRRFCNPSLRGVQPTAVFKWHWKRWTAEQKKNFIFRPLSLFSIKKLTANHLFYYEYTSHV